MLAFCIMMSQKSERRAVEAPRLVSAEASRASSVTEWVLEHQAEKCRVAVKVNKIKKGNLRASVLHERCRQQQGRECKRQGWMRGLESVWGRVCRCMCVCVHWVLGFSYVESHMFGQNYEGPFLRVCAHSLMSWCPPYTK